ncbi:MGDG synthase family glycosyltransferase [Micromonospora zhanjiangensis]|uniref:Diacylglycerol glucosyltransferase N-terminal domain-containing protein n=1 Tax=Micromonospora zhanjiangensis TaxID=1522057 RepID=A0ABV8KIH6_9ACTN
MLLTGQRYHRWHGEAPGPTRPAGPSTSTRGRVVVFSASVGAGHDGAARELAARLRAGGFEVDGHDLMELMPGRLGRALRAGYARQLAAAPRTWEWLAGGLDRHETLAALAGRLTALAAGRRVDGVLAPPPALVVSTYPLASQALGRLRRTGRLAVPVVTFLTDMSVHRLWVADGVDTHLALHEVAGEQARGLGGRDVRVTGPAVSAAFRPAYSAGERRRDRAVFGLPAQGPLALVLAGSWAVGEIEQTVEDIARGGVATPVVACGRNEALRQRLTRRGMGVAIGWTEAMPALIRACDVVVQNAGGLSSLEALACRVPVLTYRCLPGHGRTNARALAAAGWVPWVRTDGELPAALRVALAGAGGPPPPFPAADPAAALAALARPDGPADRVRSGGATSRGRRCVPAPGAPGTPRRAGRPDGAGAARTAPAGRR